MRTEEPDAVYDKEDMKCVLPPCGEEVFCFVESTQTKEPFCPHHLLEFLTDWVGDGGNTLGDITLKVIKD